jgi:hypothetical protein
MSQNTRLEELRPVEPMLKCFCEKKYKYLYLSRLFIALSNLYFSYSSRMFEQLDLNNFMAEKLDAK